MRRRATRATTRSLRNFTYSNTSSFVPTAANTRLVVPNELISSIKQVSGGSIGGSWTDSNPSRPAIAQWYPASSNIVLATSYSGTTTKAICLKLTQLGSNIFANVEWVRYWGSNVLDKNILTQTGWGGTVPNATSPTTDGYGCASINFVF